ncbi:MAG TPA: FCD domain-containing protein [Burkholderiales bacterium]|nr:FCD domain-containing protein [Burkholderiales bacterium]
MGGRFPGNPLPRIRTTPAYRLVAEAIEKRILSGELRAGEPLGTEAELVKQFGVNRSTVREGIRLLEQSGLVRRDASRRLWTGLPHYERLASRTSRALVLHQATFRELYEAALPLQIATVQAAVERATPEIIERLEANITRMEEAASDPAAVASLDREFHALVGEAAANRVLQLAREPSEMLVLPTTELISRHVPEAPARVLHAHRMYVDAIKRRDVEAGRLWARRHIEDWKKGFERAGRSLDAPIDRLYLELNR